MSAFLTLKNTFALLWQLHTNAAVYRFFPDASKRTFILLFSVYYLLFAAASTASYLAVTVPRWTETGFSAWKELQNAWPDNLEARYENGTLTFTPNERRELIYPEAFPRPEGFPALLAIVDTTISEPDTNAALLTLTQSNLSIQQEGSVTTTAWSELLPEQNFAVTKQTILDGDDEARLFLTLSLHFLAPLVFVLALLVVPAIRLLLLVPFAWLSQSLLQLTGNRLSYAQAYRFGAAVLLVAETTQLLLGTLYPSMNLHVFWWVWLILLGSISALNRKKL